MPTFGSVLDHGKIILVKNIFLTGQLIGQDDEEIAIVVKFLPRHLELTRAEPDCISFEVSQTVDPLAWDVSECIHDAGSFDLHQSRVKYSDWGRATVAIKRNHSVLGL